MTVLHDLLQEAQQLYASLEGLELRTGLKGIQYGPNELKKIASDVVAKAGNTSDLSGAHYLLASSGLSLEHTARSIGAVKFVSKDVAVANTDTDIDSFVRQSRDKDIVSVIRLRREQSDLDFKKFVAHHMASDWQSRKAKLLERFRPDHATQNRKRQEHSSARHPSERSQELGGSVLRKHQRKSTDQSTFTDVEQDLESLTWTGREDTFSQAISSLNEHRSMSQPVAICSLMAQLVRTLGSDVKNHQLADSWQILSFIADERHTEYGLDPVGSVHRPGRYNAEYADKAGTQPDAKFNQRIVHASRRYLENQFYGLVEREIARNPQDARLGGVPSVESKIRAYVNIRFYKNGQWSQPNVEIINNAPVWAVIFFLIRAGFLTEAAKYSAKYEAYLSKVEKNWPAYIQAYTADHARRLPLQLVQRIQAEYSQRIRYTSENSDPYKHALFKILGRCDLQRKSLPEVLPVTEDWMWLQLCLVSEHDRVEPAYEQFRLSDLQANMQRFGPRYFNPKGTNVLLYFQILLLSGQFERAVQYLAGHQWTDAVHFAIVLAYYGLLRVSELDEPEIQLLRDVDGSARLEFCKMICLYSRSIQKRSSTTAVEYLSLLSLTARPSTSAARVSESCYHALRQLVLETREFALLLGDVRADGSLEPGFIEKRMKLLNLNSKQDYLRRITEYAALESEREGRVADAVLLYHLSEQYNAVVGLMNKSLGLSLLDTNHSFQDIHGTSAAPLAENNDPATIARNMLEVYASNASIQSTISRGNYDTCRALLRMVDVRIQFRNGNYDGCLSIIEEFDVIPMSPSLSIGTVKKMSNDFNILDDNIARNIPDMLSIAVDCLQKSYQRLKTNLYNDPSRATQMNAIRKQAKNLVLFAGLIRYNLDVDATSWIMTSLSSSAFH